MSRLSGARWTLTILYDVRIISMKFRFLAILGKVYLFRSEQCGAKGDTFVELGDFSRRNGASSMQPRSRIKIHLPVIRPL